MAKFDIAISFADEDNWIAKDLYNLLTELGFNVYYSGADPNHAKGFFRKELAEVYLNSTLNIIIWSKSYVSKPPKSPLETEKNFIWHRHIGNSDPKSLFFLLTDESELEATWEIVKWVKLQDYGFFECRNFILEQIIQIYSATSGGIMDHPHGVEINRKGITPCKFSINNSYYADPKNRWNTLSDVLVNLMDTSILRGKYHVYLLPSGKAPLIISHSIILKTNSTALSIKRNLTKEFVARNIGQVLSGGLFFISKNGIDLPHVYCDDYDNFLNNFYNQYSKY